MTKMPVLDADEIVHERKLTLVVNIKNLKKRKMLIQIGCLIIRLGVFICGYQYGGLEYRFAKE